MFDHIKIKSVSEDGDPIVIQIIEDAINDRPVDKEFEFVDDPEDHVGVDDPKDRPAPVSSVARLRWLGVR